MLVRLCCLAMVAYCTIALAEWCTATMAWLDYRQQRLQHVLKVVLALPGQIGSLPHTHSQWP